MRKYIAILLALVMVLSLCACGAEESDADLVITRAAQDEQEETVAGEEAVSVNAGGSYAFTAKDVKLVPGDDFDPAVLGEASSVFQVPSCAIEGTDNVYNYDTFEITAFDDGGGEVIYSILIIDPELTTQEGLALGDDIQKVESLYGTSFAEEGTSRIYTRGETQLILIMQNEAVVSIEYRMAG